MKLGKCEICDIILSSYPCPINCAYTHPVIEVDFFHVRLGQDDGPQVLVGEGHPTLIHVYSTCRGGVLSVKSPYPKNRNFGKNKGGALPTPPYIRAWLPVIMSPKGHQSDNILYKIIA